MILEGIVTTLDSANRLNVAPMGPIVTPEMTTLILRPFQTSQTYQNLKLRPQGVLHVVDDVLLIAQAALNQLPSEPATFPAVKISGQVLDDCCRWFEFEVILLDDTDQRTHIEARVIHTGRRRDFFGFNRAKHAVIEATILATRLHILPLDEVQAELRRLEPLIEKTAGEQERAAWNLVCNFICGGGFQRPGS